MTTPNSTPVSQLPRASNANLGMILWCDNPLVLPYGQTQGVTVEQIQQLFPMFNPENTIYFAVGGNDLGPGTIDDPLATMGQAVINAQTLISAGPPGTIFIQIIGLGIGIDISNISIVGFNSSNGIDIYAPGWQHNPSSGDAFTVNLSGGPFNPNGGSYINVVLGSSTVTGGAKVLNLIGTTVGHRNVTRFTYGGAAYGDVYLNVKCEFNCTIIAGTLTANEAFTKVYTLYGIGSQTQQSKLNLEGVLFGGSGGSFHGAVDATNVWRYPMRKTIQLTGNITLNSGNSGFLYINSTANPYTITLPDTAGQGTPPFLIGYEATFLNLSTGSISFVAAGLSTLTGTTILNQAAQRVNCTLTANNKWEADLSGGSLSANGIQIFVSKRIGNDITGSGSYTNPYATINKAMTVAGSPAFPVQIIIMDGESYDEQLVFNSNNIYINGPAAQLIYTGLGNAITINTAGAAALFILSNVVGAGGGNTIVNNNAEAVVIECVNIQGGDIVNNAGGLIIIKSSLIQANIMNPGGGSVFYSTDIRSGTDDVGVNGISSSGSTAPLFTVKQLNSSGLLYPTSDSAAGHVITTNGAGILSLQPVSADIPPNGINIFVSQQIGNDLNPGTYLLPLATFGAALTLAGAPPPTAPVIIIGIDGNTYDEQLVINNANVYISARFAQIAWSGTGDALTINATGSGTLLEIGSIAATGGGNAIVNNVDETVILTSLILSQGDIANNGIGAFLINSDLITVNITNPGGGNVFYDSAIRVGVDGTGVYGINSTGSTAPQFTVNQFVASGITYPTVDAPSNGYVMTRTAPNTLTLQPPVTGFTSVNVQTFTVSGVYTPTSGMSQCVVEVIGGGGGGGGVTAAAAAQAAVAGGGGAGEYSKSLFPAATIGGSQAVTIGSGGAGGPAGNNNGTNGGISSLGALITAFGGNGGFGGSASGNQVSYGVFGAGGGGGVAQFTMNGNSGELGLGFGPDAIGIGGHGGDSFYGVGGEQLINLPGANGFNYGSGGGGAGAGNTAAAAGGNGANGIIIITEYII